MRNKVINLQGKTLFFTGGTGFFGKSLLRYWHSREGSSSRPEKVVILTRSPETFKVANPDMSVLKWVALQPGNIENYETMLPVRQYDAILHAATDSTLGPLLTPLQRYDQITQGTRNVLDYAVACGTKRILLTSSGGVYGKMPAAMERIPDDFMGIPDPLDTKNTYGIAKRAAEHLCAIYAAQFDLSIVVARCFAFIGRDLPMNVHFAIGNFIHDAVKKNEITVNGDGSPMRSYLDQRDLAEWLVALLERGASGAAYNVGSDMSLSLKELAYLVRDLISPGKNVRIMGRAACNSERNIYVPDIAKITRHLGVSQRYTLKQSIKDAAESLK